jgi:hypothetical protein
MRARFRHRRAVDEASIFQQGEMVPDLRCCPAFDLDGFGLLKAVWALLQREGFAAPSPYRASFAHILAGRSGQSSFAFLCEKPHIPAKYVMVDKSTLFKALSELAFLPACPWEGLPVPDKFQDMSHFGRQVLTHSNVLSLKR